MLLKTRLIPLVLLTLSPVFCKAESVIATHNFHSMRTEDSPPTLVWPNAGSSDYTVGETALVTYTGANGGTFSSAGVYPYAKYCIYLPNGGSVTASPAVDDLKRVRLSFYDASKTYTNVTVSVSTNGSDWTDMSASADYEKGQITATMPSVGDYYLKLTCTSATPAAQITEIRYTAEPCNCLKIVSQ